MLSSNCRPACRCVPNNPVHSDSLTNDIQVNPLSNSKPGLDILPSPSVLFAGQPLVVPMSLRLSDLRLRAIIVLVVSRQKGITLVFKNDPLESVKVSSSFDSVRVIQGYIQRQIEAQLREVFRSDLPSIIHRLSQRWLSETTSSNAFAASARIQTQTAFKHSDSTHVLSKSMDTPSSPKSPLLKPVRNASCPRLPSEIASESVSEAIESYDPTYGMRSCGNSPTSHPLVSGRMDELWHSSERGLGQVVEHPRSVCDEMHWSTLEADEDFTAGDSASSYGSPTLERYESHSVSGQSYGDEQLQSKSALRPTYSAMPVLHPRHLSAPSLALSESSRRSAPAEDVASEPGRALRPSTNRQMCSTLPHARRTESSPLLDRRSPKHSPSSTGTESSASSLFQSHLASSSFTSLSSGGATQLEKIAESDERPAFALASGSRRRRSPPPLLLPSSERFGPDALSMDPDAEGERSIRVSSGENEACAHMGRLSQSFQTLSPFARAFEHFTARSVPRGSLLQSKMASSDTTHQPPARGKRKRRFKIGQAATASSSAQEQEQQQTGADGSHKAGDASPCSESGSAWSDYFPRQAAKGRV